MSKTAQLEAAVRRLLREAEKDPRAVAALVDAMDEARAALLDENDAQPMLTLHKSDYPGGIAVWPAVSAIYDSRPISPTYTGFHVHAYGMSGDKILDCSALRVFIDGKEVRT